MASIIIETTDKTVTVNGWTQAKGNFTVQSLGDGYAHIRTHTGQGLRAKLEDITINGETPVSYDDLVTKAQDFFKESGTDSSDAVQSITGDLVDDTDPQNPVINNPTWGQVTGKPTEFPPSSHTHPFSEVTGTATAAQIPTLAISKISGLQGALDDKLDSADALQIGTTATTAKAGNYQPTWAQVTGKPALVGSSQEEGVGTVITNIISLTQSEYDNLTSPSASTYYIITS